METVIIFGLGNFYRANADKVKREYSVSAFVDNAAETDIDAKIYNPKDIDMARQGKILVMIYSFVEAVNWLLSMGGICRENILVGLNYYGISDKDARRRKIGRFEINDEGIVFESILTGTQRVGGISDIAKIDKLITRMEKPLPFDTDKIGTKPIDDALGFGRGHSISRHYIDRFIEMNRGYIKGSVMEIGDDHYTKEYGADKVDKLYVLHVNGGGDFIKGDLQTGEGVEEGSLDCFILTQVLDFIYDIHSSCRNVVKALKKGGTALVTVAGISQISRYDMDRWGQYWCFTDLSLRKLFADIVGEDNVRVETFGNVKAAMLRMYGACKEDLPLEDLNLHDKDYQLVIGAVVRKP